MSQPNPTPSTYAVNDAKAPSTEPATFALKQVATGYPGRPISESLTLSIARGSRTSIVGANGSGKSTVLKTIARLIRPLAGTVHLNGSDISRLPTRQIAREMAILPQMHEIPPELSVLELVEQGRFPHVGTLGMLRRQDDEAIERAIRLTRLEEFLHRPVDTLSGGERQRAWMALALAQSTEVLLLDEPTTFLDIGHQLDLLQLVSELNSEEGITVVMVLHDLNHAARFSDRIIALSDGDIVADGAPSDVITIEFLRHCFAVEASISTDPNTGSLMCVPYAPTFGEKLARSFDDGATDPSLETGAVDDE